MHIIIIIEVVKAADNSPLFQQPFGQVEADETGRARNQDLFWKYQTLDNS